jgi:peptide deformylase
MEIVLYPDPRLLQKTAPITEVTAEIRARAAEMLKLMYADRGVGLAAPQVGWSVRLFVMNPTGDASKPAEETVLVNPRLTSRKGRVRSEEGCLSFPKIEVEVDRAREIGVEWTDLDGKKHEEKWIDWKARIFQHELDHLDNVLLIHRMSEADRIQNAEALEDLRYRYETGEESAA